MSKNLSQSRIDRQNILNNNEALPAIRQHIGLQGMAFEDDYWFTVAQTADFFGVDKRTIQRYLVSFEEELTHNGYTVLKGEKLKQFKHMFGDMIYADLDFDDSQSDIDVTLSEKIDNKQKLSRLKSLGVFNFRAFLNLAMQHRTRNVNQ